MTLKEIIIEVKATSDEIEKLQAKLAQLISQMGAYVRFDCTEEPDADLQDPDTLLIKARMSQDIWVLEKLPKLGSKKIEAVRKYILENNLLGPNRTDTEISLKELCSVWKKVSHVFGQATSERVFVYLAKDLEIPIEYFKI